MVTCLALGLPGDSIPPLESELPWTLPPYADKLVHGTLFFLETWFLQRSARWWSRLPSPPAAWKPAAVIALTLAGVTELMQSLIPQRTTDGMDLIANVLGILAFVLCHLMWRRKSRTFDSATEPDV